MAILNSNGTPFQLFGGLQQFDPNSPDIDLFNSLDAEIISFASPLLYYEVFIDIDSIDQLYLEDKNKLWSPIGVQFFGYYEPIEPQNPSTAFGIDGIGDVVFECNYKAVLSAIGHMPKRGSRIFTMHLSEMWVIVDTRLTQFKLWSALHLQIICERLQENITDVKVNQPNFTIF